MCCRLEGPLQQSVTTLNYNMITIPRDVLCIYDGYIAKIECVRQRAVDSLVQCPPILKEESLGLIQPWCHLGKQCQSMVKLEKLQEYRSFSICCF